MPSPNLEHNPYAAAAVARTLSHERVLIPSAARTSPGPAGS